MVPPLPPPQGPRRHVDAIGVVQPGALGELAPLVKPQPPPPFLDHPPAAGAPRVPLHPLGWIRWWNPLGKGARGGTE